MWLCWVLVSPIVTTGVLVSMMIAKMNYALLKKSATLRSRMSV